MLLMEVYLAGSDLHLGATYVGAPNGLFAHHCVTLFVEFVEGKLEGGKRVGTTVAWGVQACDCEWLF